MLESETSQKPAERPSEKPPRGESRKPTQSQLESVASLLRGDEDGDTDADSETAAHETPGAESSADESQPKGPPKNFDDLAKRLGVKVQDLYAIEFPDATSGESRTIGQLKDVLGERTDFEVEQLRFEEHRTKQEQEIIRAQADLRQLLSMLPRSAIKPELVQAIADKQELTARQERRNTLNVIPEWSDEQAEAKDRSEMAEHLAAYGYPKGYLDNINDHRTLKYIRDNMRRQQRIERALAQVETVRKPGHGTGKSAGKSPAKSNGKSGGKVRGVTNQVAAISELLGNTSEG